MLARKLRLTVVALFCGLAGALVFSGGSALALNTHVFSSSFGGPGSGGGQLGFGFRDGIAVNTTTHDVYVADPGNARVDEFSAAGLFIRAWGWGVADGLPKFETCTLSCQAGTPGSGAGQFYEPEFISVDNSTGPSAGDVYVGDSQTSLISKFTSSGELISGWGSEGQLDGSTATNGPFGLENLSGITVNSSGTLTVLNQSREIFEFAQDSKFIANFPLAQSIVGIGSGGIASDSEGNYYALTSPGEVEAFTPSGAVIGRVAPSGSYRGLALDRATDDLYAVEAGGVADYAFSSTGVVSEQGGSQCTLTPGAGASCPATDSFGISAASDYRGIGSDSSNGNVYVADKATNQIDLFSPAVFPDVTTSGVSLAKPTSPVLSGVVNPAGVQVTGCEFEYGTGTSYGQTVACEQTSSEIGSGTEPEPVSAELAGLLPSTEYHFRLVASNAAGSNYGSDRTFTAPGPPAVDSEYVTNVASSSATIDTQINPRESSTGYSLEYGPSASYGQVITGNVGEGNSDVLVEHHLEGLQTGTTYQYRIVANNLLGVSDGPDRTFTTQPAGNNVFSLSDGRAWELVSPPDKDGALIENIEEAQAASDGSGIYYTASAPLGEGITGHLGQNITGVSSSAALSRRGPGGWRTIDISPKQTLPPDGVGGGEIGGAAEAFYLFSPDLSSVAFEPRGAVAPQSEGITERTLYLRDNEDGTYLPLVNPGNVPPETKFGPTAYSEDMGFVAATPDLAHVVLSSGVALTPEAVSKVKAGGELAQNLYEWTEGKLQLVNIPQAPPSLSPEAYFGSSTFETSGASPDAMSSDGRWVVFRYGQDGSQVTYYVRDMVEKKTVRFGPEDGYARFETMNSDGSKIFYLESETDFHLNGGIETEGELYVFDPTTGADVDLTATHLDGEPNADVENKLVGTSEDGSVVYFVAKGVLASGAVEGANNLYVLREDGAGWSTTFIATLSSEDGKDWQSFNTFRELEPITSRVSSDGRYLAFMSENSLTGYDNHDAVSGQPDEETYLYDSIAKRLVCVSCDPSGTRPVGVLDRQGATEPLVIDPNLWNGNEEEEHSNAGRGHWLASMLPPAWHVDWKVAFYQPRSLSDSGRLFFESTDALVPQDTNGLADVYEYEPTGIGSCSNGSVTFSEHTAGCVSLISSGQSASESAFLDASETGNDVFFITTGRLVPEDYDSSYDVYDAHVCTTAVPCVTAPVSSPPCTSGDSCKAAPSPQPAIFGAAPSATFSGIGNVSEGAAGQEIKHKPKSKAKKQQKKKRSKRKGSGKARRSSRAHARTIGRGK